MPIIAYLGKDITEYTAECKNHLTGINIYCPVHSLKLTPHATYTRNIKDYGASIPINRFKCPLKTCNYTQSILPDFLQSYKHYSAHEIASVLIETEQGVTALAVETDVSISTVRRWIAQYQLILNEKISKVKSVINQTIGKIVNETILSPNQPMASLHKLLSYLPEIHHTNTLGAAFIYGNALRAPT